MDDKTAYFLIGGSGFIGKSYINHLQAKGINAQNIVRGQIADGTSGGVKEHVLDSLNVSEHRNVIVDFAYTSIPNTSFSDPVKDFSENLYNVNAHLNFALKLPNVTYIYVSSGGTVYGNVHTKQPIVEHTENYPVSPYGITKLAAEKYCMMYNGIYGVDVKIVRPSNIYGPGQKPFRGQGFVSTALAKVLSQHNIQVFGDGSIIRDYLYIDDFCSALDTVIRKGENRGVYNVGSTIGLTINEVMMEIGKASKAPVLLENLPSRPFDVDYNVLDSSKLEHLGWKPTVSMEEGVGKTCEWIKNYLQNE